MANYWMHNGFLQVEGEKMSKSLGNFVTIHELLAENKFGGRKWSGEVLRLAMLMTQYRQPIDWTLRSLGESKKVLDHWYEIVGDMDVPVNEPVDDAMLASLCDDLNTPNAIARLHALASEIRGPASGKTALELKGSFKISAMLLGLLTRTRGEYL